MANQNSKRPDYRLYQVKGDQRDKAFWQPVGVAWAHTDGKGVTMTLDSIPLNGRITMREIAEREEGGSND